MQRPIYKIISILLVLIVILMSLSSCALTFRKATATTNDESSIDFEIENNNQSNPHKSDMNSGDFDNSLIIGDSRTVGVQLCNEDMENVTFFAMIGLTVAALPIESIEVGDLGYFTLEEILAYKNYDRVYMSIGVNDLECNIDDILSQYEDIVDMISQAQPNTPIYLIANLHVTDAYSQSNESITNEKIDELNNGIENLCDGTYLKFANPNELFDNYYGSLSEEYSSDGIHLEAFGYQMLGEWLKEIE